jgi:hypothetical protein
MRRDHFGVLSDLQLQIARRKLVEQWKLGQIAAYLDTTARELDLALWRALIRPS